MNTQEILTRVNDAAQPFEVIEKAEDSRSYNAESIAWEMKRRLAILAGELEAQLRLEYAAQNGSANATRTITKMLNYLKKHDNRESLHYAWIDGDGRQCVCDGYRAFRLKEPLPLEPRPEGAGDTLDLDKIVPDITKDYAAVPLPSIQEVKAHIAVERAKAGKAPGKRRHGVIWDFGECKPAVNADLLLDLLQVLPDATEVFCKTGLQFMYSPLYVRTERGDAVLLPCRTPAKAAETEAMAKAKADADAAIREQAKAEGVDEDIFRERMERKAKRKAKAEKELADKLAWYSAETTRSEHFALELDDLEYLVGLIEDIQRNAA